MIANRAFVNPNHSFKSNITSPIQDNDTLIPSNTTNPTNTTTNPTNTTTANPTNTTTNPTNNNINNIDNEGGDYAGQTKKNLYINRNNRDNNANPNFVNPNFTFSNKQYDNTSQKQIKDYISDKQKHIDTLDIDEDKKKKYRRSLDTSYKQKKFSDKSNISPAEKCTVETSKKYGLYPANGNGYFNNTIRNQQSIMKSTNDFILNNRNIQPYSVCSTDKENEKAYENCAFGSPWLSLDDNGKCRIPKNNCPPQFKYNRYNDTCELDTGITMYQRDKVGFCDTTWYDWMMIPNFHLNNRYSKYRRDESDDPKDVTRCFKPCPVDFIPYDNTTTLSSFFGTDTNIPVNQCSLKGSKGNYCPMALINLLYTSKEHLEQYYNDVANTTANTNNDIPNIIDRAYNEIIQSAIEYIQNSTIQIDDIVSPKIGDEAYTGCYDTMRDPEIIHTYKKARDVSKMNNHNQEKLKDVIRMTYKYKNQEDIDKHHDMLLKAIQISFDNVGDDYADTNRSILKKIMKDFDPNEVFIKNNPYQETENKSNNNVPRKMPYITIFDTTSPNDKSIYRNMPYTNSMTDTMTSMLIYTVVIIICILFGWMFLMIYRSRNVKFVLQKLNDIVIYILDTIHSYLTYIISNKYNKVHVSK